MGYIYIDSNYFVGWSSSACIGSVDSAGYVYCDVNYFTGFSSGSCVGRIDYETGFVYNDINYFDGWTSSACIGYFDGNGYVYNKPNYLSGLASSACVGQVDSNGYVYKDTHYLSGFSSANCVGRVEGEGNQKAEAAALLLLLLPHMKAPKEQNKGHQEQEYQKQKYQEPQYNTFQEDTPKKSGSSGQGGVFWEFLVFSKFVFIAAIVCGICYVIKLSIQVPAFYCNIIFWIPFLVLQYRHKKNNPETVKMKQHSRRKRMPVRYYKYTWAWALLAIQVSVFVQMIYGEYQQDSNLFEVNALYSIIFVFSVWYGMASAYRSCLLPRGNNIFLRRDLWEKKIIINCNACQQKIRIPKDHPDIEVRCQKCGNIMRLKDTDKRERWILTGVFFMIIILASMFIDLWSSYVAK